MRLLVCGSRDYADRRRLFEVLDAYKQEQGIEVIIEGCARGADALAEEWAVSRHVGIVHCPADWARYHRAAGAIRNREMGYRHPDTVIAFFLDPMRRSRGTADMVRVARAKDIPVVLG